MNCIIDQVSAFLRRFVFLKDPKHYRLISTWIVASHLHQDFDYTGYLVVSSPEPECGKTRLLEIIQPLSYKSSDVLISPTEAVLFRTASDGTQVLDEVDTWLNTVQLKAVMNAGFRKGAAVIRLEELQKAGSKTYEKKSWPCYAPRVLGGIKLETKLDVTTLSRAFLIPMVRRTKSERGERFRLKKVEPEFVKLQAAISAWASKNRDRIIERSESDFPMLDHFNERTIDIAEPLMAVTAVAYPEGQRTPAELELVDAVASLRQEKNTYGVEHRVLTRLSKLAEAESPLVGNGSELMAKCGSGDGFDESDISATLRKYGHELVSKRIDGGEAKRRFVLECSGLQDLVMRFGCGNSEGAEMPLG